MCHAILRHHATHQQLLNAMLRKQALKVGFNEAIGIRLDDDRSTKRQFTNTRMKVSSVRTFIEEGGNPHRGIRNMLNQHHQVTCLLSLLNRCRNIVQS